MPNQITRSRIGPAPAAAHSDHARDLQPFSHARACTRVASWPGSGQMIVHARARMSRQKTGFATPKPPRVLALRTTRTNPPHRTTTARCIYTRNATCKIALHKFCDNSPLRGRRRQKRRQRRWQQPHPSAHYDGYYRKFVSTAPLSFR